MQKSNLFVAKCILFNIFNRQIVCIWRRLWTPWNKQQGRRYEDSEFM